jgi:hypothetical protein
MNMLSLADALASNRLSEFVDQAEKQGIGPADRTQFDKMVGHITAPLPEGQTSHLPVGDCLPET